MRLIKLAIFTALLGSTLGLTACDDAKPTPELTKVIGSIEVWDTAVETIISKDAKIEVLAEGFQWSEGPAWDSQRQQLYFSDVPQNKAHIWSDKKGLQTFLDPSGISSENANGFREAGTNGLLMMPDGQLLMANHGKRALELIEPETKVRSTLVHKYNGKSFNSPNDITRAKDGTLYFTDPPYGLEGLNASPLKELSFSGIFKLSPNGDLSIVDPTQTFPNGIALSPDEQVLYVAVSDSEAPKIMKYTKDSDGNFSNGHLWFDAKPYQDKGLPGLPDGMAVSDKGYVFATGPGGVFILSPEGKPLGQIQTGRATANCTFGDDGKTLYITAGNALARVRLLQGITF